MPIPQQSQIESLTPREREVLTLIAEGLSLLDISIRLDRKLKTVESHRLALGRKLNATNRVELTRIAIAAGLVPIQPEVLDQTAFDRQQELDCLGEISESVQNVSGRAFNALCCAISRVLNIRYAALCVSESIEKNDDRYTVAIAERGIELPSIRYDMTYTPVGKALEFGDVCITDGLGQAYPEDRFVQENGIRSYLAIRLDGDFSGHQSVLSVLDDRPMNQAEMLKRIMRFFAPRAAAELAGILKDIEIEMLRSKLAGLKPLDNTKQAGT